MLFRLSGPRLRPWICVASGDREYVAAQVGRYGASFLRASDWMADGAFEDELHLSPAGARAFSARLATLPVDIQTPRR